MEIMEMHNKGTIILYEPIYGVAMYTFQSDNWTLN